MCLETFKIHINAVMVTLFALLWASLWDPLDFQKNYCPTGPLRGSLRDHESSLWKAETCILWLFLSQACGSVRVYIAHVCAHTGALHTPYSILSWHAMKPFLLPSFFWVTQHVFSQLCSSLIECNTVHYIFIYILIWDVSEHLLLCLCPLIACILEVTSKVHIVWVLWVIWIWFNNVIFYVRLLSHGILVRPKWFNTCQVLSVILSIYEVPKKFTIEKKRFTIVIITNQ